MVKKRASGRGRNVERFTDDDLEGLVDVAFLFGREAVERDAGTPWEDVAAELRRRGIKFRSPCFGEG